MPDPSNIVIGIDLGGTHFQVGAVDAEGTIVARTRGRTPDDGHFDHVSDALAEAVRTVCAEAGLALQSVAGVGVGAPGAAVPATGVILQAGNLPWNDVPLGDDLSTRLDGVRVVVDNDVNAATVGEHRLGGRRACLVLERKLLDLAALIVGQPRVKDGLAVCYITFKCPVLARLERFNFFFALDDHPQGGALHPSGGEFRHDLLPQQWREVEAEQEVEGTPRLLRVDQFLGKAPRMFHRFLDGAFRDFVKHHAMHILAVQIALIAQDLVQVPRNSLAFAVGVSREVERVGFLQSFGNCLDVFLFVFRHFETHRKAIGRINRAFFTDQIAHMAIRGEYLEIATEILLDGLGLGR